MNERNFEGNWWVPEAPSEKVPGQLLFDNEEGLRLRLSGVLATSDLFSVHTASVPIIFGEVSGSSTGSNVTLFASLPSHTELSTVARQELKSRLAVLGSHVGSEEQLRITSAEIGFTQLPPWLNVGGFTLDVHSDIVKAGEPVAYDVHYRPVRLPTVRIPPGELSFILRSMPPLFATRTYPLQEWTGINIDLATELPFWQFKVGTLWYLQNFFTFATDHRNTIDSLYVKMYESGETVEVLFQDLIEHEPLAHPIEMLFTYAVIADNLQKVLEQWFGLYAMLGPVLNALFSTIYRQVTAVDTRFLNIIQAAESYDRRMNPPGDLSAHRLRVNRTWLSAPPEYRDWVRGKLWNAHELFLSARLKRVFDRLGHDFLRRLFNSRDEQKTVLWRMGVWRNALTHVTSTVEENAEHLVWLHIATNQLLCALKANLLLDIGFSPGDLPERFKHNQTYNFFAHHQKGSNKRGPTTLTS